MGFRTTHAGLSIIESLVATTIAATAAASVAPGLTQWRQQLAVQQLAAEFETDVYQARSAAVARREVLQLTLQTEPGNRCWVLYAGPRGACGCTSGGEASCTPEGRPARVKGLPASARVGLDSNTRQFSFDPVHATVTPGGTVKFAADGARSVHQVISITGRVRACVPGGGLPGYLAC